MAVSRTVLLLAAAMSSCCAWHLPALPAQHRAQYYVLHDDGAYKHGFDTGAGQWASARADSSNQVTGEWQAVDDAGQAVHWAYTAGIQGYVPVLGNTPGKAPVHVVPIVATTKHVPVAPPAWQAPPAQSKLAVDDQAGTGDASYSFQYSAEDHSRQESANKEGNVVGSYQFKADDGVQRRVDYVAGKDTGFVARGDHLPVAPEVPAVPVQQQAPQTKSWSQQTTWTSSANAPVSTGSSSHSKAAASSQESINNADGSYQFQYVAEDHSRQESANKEGNVVGSYQFKADDGVQRRVDYVAGKDTGFVARGDHLPVAPEVPVVPSAPATNSWSSQTKQSSWSSTPTVGHVPVVSPNLQAPTWTASSGRGDTHGDSEGAKSFSYSYDAVLSSKQETADEQGNVAGSFQFVDGAGQQRSLTYTVNGDEGFIAKGDHLPVAPEVPAVPVQQQAPVVPQTKSWSQQTTWTSSANAPVSTGSSSHSKAAASSQESINNADGSYQFQYVAEDHSRQESANKEGNVVGSYQFKADDGVQRRVDYVAGKDTGFVARGDHLPVAPEVPAVPVQQQAPQAKTWSQQTTWTSSANAPVLTGSSSHSKAAASSQESINNADGSYQFQYVAEDHSRQESSDAHGSVVGSYQFKADDGVQRRVDYVAGKDTGFVARGDHLPVAPEVPAVPVQQQAPQAKSWSQQASWTSSGTNAVKTSGGGWSRQDEQVQGGVEEDTSSVEDQQQVVEDEKVLEEDQAQRAKDDAILQADAQALEIEQQTNQQQLLQQEAELNAQAALAQSDADLAQQQVDVQKTKDQTAEIQEEEDRNRQLVAVQQVQQQWQQQEQVQQVQQKSATHSSNVAGSDSYSFGYETDTQSVQQQSGAGNTARGSYSFVAPDDRQWRTVDWTAAAGTGFVAKGNHLPVAPLPQEPVAPVSWASSAVSKSSTGGVKTSSHSVQASHDDQDNGDGSYSYSYKTDTADKQEVADKDGSVTGSFSYHGPDGILRRLDYTANDKDGFVATGDHLPGSSSSSGGHVSTWTTDAKTGAAGRHGANAAKTWTASSGSGGAWGTKSTHVAPGTSGSQSSLGGWGSKTASEGVKSSHVSATNSGGWGTKSSSHATTVTTGSHGPRPYAPLPVVKTPVAKHFPEVEVTRYLPPESPKKFGYVFEAKA